MNHRQNIKRAWAEVHHHSVSSNKPRHQQNYASIKPDDQSIQKIKIPILSLNEDGEKTIGRRFLDEN